MRHNPGRFDDAAGFGVMDPDYVGTVRPTPSLTEEWRERQLGNAQFAPVAAVRREAKRALRVLEVPEAFWGKKPADSRFEFGEGFFVADVEYSGEHKFRVGDGLADVSLVTFNIYGPDGSLREKGRQAPRYMFERLRVRNDFLPDPSVAATDPTPAVAVQASTVEDPAAHQAPAAPETLADRNARYLKVDPLPENPSSLFGRNLAAHFPGWRYTQTKVPDQVSPGSKMGELRMHDLVYEVHKVTGGYQTRREVFPNERGKRQFREVYGLTPDLTHFPEANTFKTIYEAVEAASRKIDVMKREGLLVSNPGQWKDGSEIGQLYLKPEGKTGMNAAPAFTIVYDGKDGRGKDVFKAIQNSGDQWIATNTDLEKLFDACRVRIGILGNPELPKKPAFTWEFDDTMPNNAAALEYDDRGVAATMKLPDGSVAYEVVASSGWSVKYFVIRARHPLLKKIGADGVETHALRERDYPDHTAKTAKELCEESIAANWPRLIGR